MYSKHILYLIVAFSVSLIHQLSTAQTLCKRSGVQCISPNAYQTCWDMLNNPTLVGVPQYCKEDEICDDIGCRPCVKISSVPQKPSVPPPACDKLKNVTATEFTQYYECVAKLWWFYPVLKSCNLGEYFDPEIQKCRPVKGHDFPIEGPLEKLDPPVCDGSKTNYPTGHCKKYYKCVKCLFWWKIQEETCVSWEYFNETSGGCVRA